MTYTPVPPDRWIEPQMVEYEDFPDSPLTTESTWWRSSSTGRRAWQGFRRRYEMYGRRCGTSRTTPSSYSVQDHRAADSPEDRFSRRAAHR
jgi:hypothetical protein